MTKELIPGQRTEIITIKKWNIPGVINKSNYFNETEEFEGYEYLISTVCNAIHRVMKTKVFLLKKKKDI